MTSARRYKLQKLVAPPPFPCDYCLDMHNKDKTLGDLGRKILSTPFLHPLAIDSALLAAVTDAHVRNAHRHVTVLNNNANLVSLYCGGAVRCFATFTNDYLSACRVADMLIFKFGEWRLQRQRAVTDADFNFSAFQAALDLQNEPGLAAIITDVEAHLRSIGALLDPEHPDSIPATMKRQKSATLSDLLARVEALEKKLSAV